jgi:hypothetical protein
MDFVGTKVQVVLYSSLIFTWGYSRLYVYGMMVHVHYISPNIPFQGSKAPQRFMIGISTILYVLHVYWFILFLKIGVVMAKKGKGVDLINTIPQGNQEEKKKAL